VSVEGLRGGVNEHGPAGAEDGKMSWPGEVPRLGIGNRCRGRGDDVDIKNTADGPTVGYTANGEWLPYTVNIQATGSYTPSFRIANGMTSSGSVHLELNGSNISGPISVPSTGSWNTQTTITRPNLNLTQGTHTLKVVFDVTPVDLNWMEFTQTSTPTPTPSPTACHLYTPTSTIPSGFGAPGDVFSANEMGSPGVIAGKFTVSVFGRRSSP
jgi:hypothetical protein